MEIPYSCGKLESSYNCILDPLRQVIPPVSLGNTD
jgi:hypothetical protein